MKTKLILILLLGLLSLNVNAQNSWNLYNIDTNNVIKPEIFELPCMDGTYMSSVNMYSSYIYGTFFREGDDSINVVAVAQPMHVDTLTALKSLLYDSGLTVSVSGFGDNLQTYLNGYPDTNYTYFQIWDETLTNLLYQINYDSVYSNAIDIYRRVREINFDSSIVVNGNFYVVLTFDPNLRQYYGNIESNNVFLTRLYLNYIPKMVCEEFYEKYPRALIKLEGESNWIYPNEVDFTNISGTHIHNRYQATFENIFAFLVYPKIDTAFDWATWNAQNSALNEIQEREKQINVFPNPAKDKITIESATELESIEIKNLLGITQKSLKVKGNKVTVPISDLEKGTYLVSIRTSKYTSTNKFVKE